MAETKLTAPNGGTVSVAAERVKNLLRYGFAEVEKAPAKKSASSKSSSKS